MVFLYIFFFLLVKISKFSFQGLMLKFRDVVYAHEEEEMENKYEELIQSNEAVKYPKFIAYLEGLYEMKEDWCTCFRKDIPMRGNNTNNFVEAQFLVLKDNVLNRTKELNINGLIDKLVVDFMDHFKTKLLSVANGRFDGIYSSRYQGKTKKKKVKAVVSNRLRKV